MKVLDGKLRLFDLDQIDSSCDGSHICDVGVKILRKESSVMRAKLSEFSGVEIKIWNK